MDKVREALEPFARKADEFNDDEPDDMIGFDGSGELFTIGDFRRARTALFSLRSPESAVGDERERCARVVEAHLCTPWRTDGVTGWRDDAQADYGNMVIKKLAAAIRAALSEEEKGNE